MRECLYHNSQILNCTLLTIIPNFGIMIQDNKMHITYSHITYSHFLSFNIDEDTKDISGNVSVATMNMHRDS